MGVDFCVRVGLCWCCWPRSRVGVTWCNLKPPIGLQKGFLARTTSAIAECPVVTAHWSPHWLNLSYFTCLEGTSQVYRRYIAGISRVYRGYIGISQVYRGYIGISSRALSLALGGSICHVLRGHAGNMLETCWNYAGTMLSAVCVPVCQRASVSLRVCMPACW